MNTLYVLLFMCIICCGICSAFLESAGSGKLYTNDLTFQLRDVKYLDAVKEYTSNEGFTFEGKIVCTNYLFRKSDMISNDAGYLDELQKKLDKYVVSITRDYERPINFVYFSTSKDSKNSHVEITTSGEGIKTSEKGVILGNTISIVQGFTSATERSPPTRHVRVGVVDAGFQIDHRNLEDAVNKELSYNFINNDNDTAPNNECYEMNPTDPRFSHGTSCMGRIAAKCENGCDPGVAPNAKLVGLRAINCKFYFNAFKWSVTDSVEAKALAYKPNDIDVLSCSYGNQDGHGFYGPGVNSQSALQNGVEEGRECRGRIFVYPSGNGVNDNCNFDGYANSIYTITVANVDTKGKLPSNKEICPCAMAAAVGDGFRTTALRNTCISGFQGSSAATAVAAGYIAEVLHVNRLLSKRDIEHIIVLTAYKPAHVTNWRSNGAGHQIHEQIGFGQLDLDRMKERAQSWPFLPLKRTCIVLGEETHVKITSGKDAAIIEKQLNNSNCRNSSQNVLYLEHVQLELNLSCSNMSYVEIHLVSPNGTRSPLLTSITFDSDSSPRVEGLLWTFLSVHFWGENPLGEWTVQLTINNAIHNESCVMLIKKLILHGTTENPKEGGHPVKCPPDFDSNIDPIMPKTSSYTFGIIFGSVAVTVVGLVIVLVVLYFYRTHAKYQRAQTDEPLTQT